MSSTLGSLLTDARKYLVSTGREIAPRSKADTLSKGLDLWMRSHLKKKEAEAEKKKIEKEDSDILSSWDINYDFIDDENGIPLMREPTVEPISIPPEISNEPIIYRELPVVGATDATESYQMVTKVPYPYLTPTPPEKPVAPPRERTAEDILADAMLRWQQEKKSVEVTDKEEKSKLQSEYEQRYLRFKKTIGTVW